MCLPRSGGSAFFECFAMDVGFWFPHLADEFRPFIVRSPAHWIIEGVIICLEIAKVRVRMI